MCHFATPGGVEIRALRAKILKVLRTKIFCYKFSSRRLSNFHVRSTWQKYGTQWVVGQFCVFLLEKWTRKWRFSGQKRKFWDSFAFFSNDN